MPKTNKPTTALRLTIAGAAIMAAMASLFMAGDGVLRMQLDTAFSTMSASPHQAASHQPQKAIQPTIAGSEDYWLGDVRRSPTTPASWNEEARITVGDRVELTLKGIKRDLEVIAVQAAPAGLLNVPGTEYRPAISPLIVTLKAFGTNDRPIHLMLDGDQDLQGFVRVSQRPHEL